MSGKEAKPGPSQKKKASNTPAPTSKPTQSNPNSRNTSLVPKPVDHSDLGKRGTRASIALVDITFGSARSAGNDHAETWKTILEDDTNYFDDINDILKDPAFFQSEKRRDTLVSLHEDEITAEDFVLDGVGSYQDPASIGSIQPTGITINSDFKASSVQSDFMGKSPNPARRVMNCIPQFKKTPYEQAHKELTRCADKVGKYYHSVNEEYEKMNEQLRFPTSAKIPPGINIISAQLWFITFTLARRLSHDTPIPPHDTLFFRDKYHMILSYCVRMSAIIRILDKSLRQFEKRGEHYIRGIKKILTGKSTTDLSTSSEISPEDDFFVDGQSWTRLTRQGMSQLNWFKRPSDSTNTSVDMREQDSEEASHRVTRFLSAPDTLTERKNMDIFIKNVTKAGWMNYENHFPFEQRVRLVRELLKQSLGGMTRLIGCFPRLKQKIQAGNRSWCRPSLLPWLKEIGKCVKFIQKHPAFCSQDFERIRFQAYSAEIRLGTVVSRGQELKAHLEDIVQVATLCCGLLERRYHLFLPNYQRLSKLAIENPVQKKRRLSMTTADEEDDEFYLNEYSQTLKEIPIYFRVCQFILSKRIEARERHSGADFDGLRFF